MVFNPNYQNIVDAACNRIPSRMPLYEHLIDVHLMETVLDTRFAHLHNTDKRSFFREYCRFFLEMGYDTVSWECCAGGILVNGGALGGGKPGAIQGWEDFEKYPWDTLEQRYFDAYSADFEALRQEMPQGMKAIGGVGNGIFELVQDLTGYMNLCFLREDEPELYEVLLAIWKRFLAQYADIYCVCRFGDDLGFKSATLLPPDDIRRLIIPQYKKIIDAVHEAGKPFLLHSCGNIFSVMDDLIDAGIDAKHSNEDQIALFPQWPKLYGHRIGFFGGIDTDAVCRLPKDEMTEYIRDVISQYHGKRGFAFGSGNSITWYTPPEQYLHMIRTVRQIRGDTL